MKLTTFILLVSLLQVSAAGFAQKITLNEKNASIEQVFKAIHNQSGYNFIYTGKLISKSNPVTINLKDASLDEALKACFTGQPLDYTIEQKTIVVKEKIEPVKSAPVPPKDVTGHVADRQGVPLVSATVKIKRTNTGTLTDVKGNFTIRDVLPDDILIISYIGYKPVSIKVGDQTVFNVVMEETTNVLDAVVVQAYGQTSQRLNTGNIATVTAKQIETHPVMNVLDALQGQVPGLVIQQRSGYASAPVNVSIRGQSSISLSSDPLFVVDGVPLTILSLSGNGSNSANLIQSGIGGPANGQSPLFNINPADIESVTVLKDADATAIYGSRGANGVIIINTKKGVAGKSKFDLNVYGGLSETTGTYDLMNLSQYMTMRREAFRNDGIAPNAGNAYDLLLWNKNRSTDWLKAAFGGIGRTDDVQSSFSGGDKQNTFRISGDYHHQTSPLNYSGADQRGSVAFNLNHKSINQRLNISFTSMYSYAQSNLISLNYSGLLPPDAPGIFDAQGHLNYAGWRPVDNLFSWGNLLRPYVAKTDFLNSQLAVTFEVFKGLNFSTSLGYSTYHNTQIATNPIASQDPFINPTGGSSFGTNDNTNVIIEPTLEYKRLIGKGNFSFLIGGSAQSTSQDASNIQGYGYINDALIGSISNAPLKNATDGHGQYKYAAIFGRINYNWADEYILNLSARRDGSSRFGPGNQFGNFGAVGAAWIFTQEKWLKDNLAFLSFGKLRGSYGITGSDQIGDYRYLTAWTASAVNPYQVGTPAYIPTQLANPDFHWEVNKKLEVALDLGFLNDRITIEGSWYRNRCDNQLVDFPLPALTGFGSVTDNSPASVQNTGMEITIKAKVIDQKDFTLSINVNDGRNWNKLLAYPNLAQSPYASILVIGQPLSLQRVLHYTGVDPQTGQYTFEDKNKDGYILTDIPSRGGDYYYRERNILFDGGFGIDMRYKGLQVNLLFTIRDNPFVQSAIIGSGDPGQIANQSAELINSHWQKPGDIARYARFTTQPSQSDYYFGSSDGIYSNGSYIRLQNASVSYDFKGNWMKKIGVQGCKVYFRGEDLFILTKYDGIDPDTPGLGSLPPSKVFTAGLQFSL